MKARDIMMLRPASVTPDEPLTQVAQIMRDLDIGSVPVVESPETMRLQGIITDRDIAIRHVAENHDNGCLVQHHMSTEKLRTVAVDDEVEDVIEGMKVDQLRRIPVVDAEQRLVGIISQADIAIEGLGDRQVSEVVGKISESRLQPATADGARPRPD